LPATRVVPKELLPVFDTPSLQHTVDEAVGAGINRVIVVTSRAKPAIEAFTQLQTAGVQMSVVYQDAPRGLGHAVLCSREAVGDDAFAVLLPDELLGSSSHLRDLIAEHEASGRTAIGLQRVPLGDVSSYGCVATSGELDGTGRVAVSDVVEKPSIADAPSDLVIVGRYVFGSAIWETLEKLQPSAGGELQLSDAIGVLARRGDVCGVQVNCSRHDTGTPLGMLTASIDAALRRDDVSPVLRAWLERRLST
jgi:UTP--glucose-1-phosphate uridylyltransferase